MILQNHDLLRMILSKLPVQTLYLIKTVCKLWQTIICDFNKFILYQTNVNFTDFVDLIYVSGIKLHEISETVKTKYTKYFTPYFTIQMYLIGAIPEISLNDLKSYYNDHVEFILLDIINKIERIKNPAIMYNHCVKLIKPVIQYKTTRFHFTSICVNWRYFGADFVLDLLKNNPLNIEFTLISFEILVYNNFPKLPELFAIKPRVVVKETRLLPDSSQALMIESLINCCNKLIARGAKQETVLNITDKITVYDRFNNKPVSKIVREKILKNKSA